MIMRKKIFVLLSLTWLFMGCNARAQVINIYYIDNQGSKVVLEKETFYDVEEKPTVFYIQDKDEKKGIYIIEVYRFIGSERHFYKSFTLSGPDISNGFNLEGIFTDITSPFINSSGFVLKVCRTDKQHYLRLKKRDECNFSDEYKVLKED